MHASLHACVQRDVSVGLLVYSNFLLLTALLLHVPGAAVLFLDRSGASQMSFTNNVILYYCHYRPKIKEHLILFQSK